MTAAFGATHWPTDIRVSSADKTLTIDFDNGESFTLPAELLRVESPSAEVRGHGGDTKKIIAGRRHVGIMNVEPIGNYAIRIEFDDLHDSGLYSWQYLYELGRDREAIWQQYLDALEREGLSRDP